MTDADLDELERAIAAVDAANRADAGTESSPATRAAVLAAIWAYEMVTWRHGPALVAEARRLRARVAELEGPQIADKTAAAGGTSGPYRVR